MLNPGATRQEVLGFGAAFTDASCWVISQIPEEQRADLMHELFSPDEMALNVCRTCTGSSDYSRSVYSFDEGDDPDPDLKRFSINHDKALHSPHSPGGAQAQSRLVSVLFALESAGVDEV